MFLCWSGWQYRGIIDVENGDRSTLICPDWLLGFNTVRHVADEIILFTCSLAELQRRPRGFDMWVAPVFWTYSIVYTNNNMCPQHKLFNDVPFRYCTKNLSSELEFRQGWTPLICPTPLICSRRTCGLAGRTKVVNSFIAQIECPSANTMPWNLWLILALYGYISVVLGDRLQPFTMFTACSRGVCLHG